MIATRDENTSEANAGTTRGYSDNDIAVVGIAGQFPMADDLEQFWEAVKNGKDCVGDLPRSRREDWLPFYSEEALDDISQFGFLERINRFDARFFGIAPGEAVYIDPTQRLLLETVYQALDYGGYNGGQLAHIPTGVFISHGNSGYKELISKPDFSMAAEMGNLPAVSAGRVSHFFNLYGPSLFIDTACSSSLAALHYACESIKQGDCSMAIVGAVSVQAYYDGKTAGMDTPSGDGGEIPVDTGLPQRYRVFDKNASVGVDGEGVGVMVLKPLKQALADRDIICAVIKGTAINHNGSRTATISGQKPETQAEVILKALERANIEPGTLSYIEANGAATQMGDPIEIKTISHVMRGTTDRKEFCAVGTVKANIGHLNHASGMAGLIKTILSLREKQIPPLALFKEPNPYIDFENSPVYIPTRLRDWAVENNIPRRAGINSFSLNGTNCHIVLEEAPVLSPLSSPPHADIITISAKTEGSLKMTCRALAQYLEKNSAVPINDICYTMNTGRGRYEHRFSAVCDNRGRLVELLDNFVENGFKPDDPAVLYDHPPTGKAAAGSKTVFLFSGSKEELGQLGVDFQAKGFIAARYIDECRRWYDLETYPRARFFAFQYALAKMWMDLGVKPAFVLGFGVGKYVSKAVSGNMELEEALKQAVESRGEDTFNKEKFKTNVKLLASKGQTLFLEIGPPNELGRLIEEMSPGIPGLRVLYSYGSEDHEKTLLRSIASLYNQGTPIDFTLLFQGNKVVLPAYRFDRRRYWISGSLPGRPAQKSVSVGTAAPGTLSPDQMKQKLVQIWREFFGIDTLGVRDDFFQLGGDSLKAMSVAALIHKALHVRIPLTEFFSRPTIEGLVGFIRDTVTNRYFSLEPVEKKDYYPLSFAQKRIYILQQMSPQSTAYNMQQMGVIEGEPDPGILDRAFNRLIHRHESLRTSFHLVDQESVQRIHHHAAFKIQYHDLTANRNSGDGPGTGDVDDVVSRGIRPFDLAQAPLLRVHLIKQDHNIHILVVDMHHIVSDGISHALLLQDFMTLYKGETLEQPALQYKDFSDWQNSVKGKEMVKQQKEYWLNAYGGDIPLLNLPVDFPRPRVQSFEGRDIPFEIGVEETGGLKELAGKQGTTLYTILLAVFNILLAKISGQEDIVVGTPVAGRRHVEMEPVIGMFVNTLALRNFPDGETSFTGFLQTVKENALNAFENQDYPFEELVEEIAVNRDVSRNPLFDVMFVFQNIDFSEIRIPALNLKPYKHESRKAKFDLTLRSEEAAGKLFLHLGYCIKLFKEESVHRFVSFFKEIVSSLLRQPNQAISRVEIINREEKKQILYDFNRAETEEYPHGITIGELFETQTTKTPNRVAVSAGGTGAGHPELTYSRLNEKANQLARLLRAKGVKPDSVVGLMMDRSPWMLVGIMAIIKAGGAYLPIDPQSPGGRLRFTLSDSRAILLLTTGGLMAKQKTALETAVPGNILAIDDETLYTGDSTNPVKVNEIHNLVYVIYTSGTSGKPKGVMLEHRNLSYLVNGLNREIYRDYAPGFNICFVSPYVFDASVKQIFAALLLGHSLYIVPEEARLDGRALWRYYLENQIHVSDGTPTHLRLLLESIGEEAADIGVSHFIIGGEDLPIGLVKEFLSKFPGRAPEIINIYGPTECTVDTSLFRVTGETVRQLHHGVPIGKPMPNCRVYILDRWDRLQPVGIPGELCISGGGVGRGYLNRLALTGEKFVTDPFNSRDNTAGMYRSGDLARWLPDGNIEFVGRIDQQVKIRGFRVELGETEAQLTRHPQIKEAVVALVEENGDREKELRAYIVPDNELTASVPELKEFLSANLPHYMIPAFFVQIEKIPLTSNGKVDRRRLEAGGKKLGTGVEYIAPESDTEKQVAGIWKEILKLDDVGVHDNFFDLGGNSLKAIRLNNRLNEVLQKEIALVVLFEHVTISSFVRYLERQKDTGEELAQKEARAAQRTQKVKERRGDRRMRRKGEN